MLKQYQQRLKIFADKHFAEFNADDFFDKRELKEGLILLLDLLPIGLVISILAHFSFNSTINDYFLTALDESASPALWNIFGTIAIIYFFIFFISKNEYFRTRAYRILASAYDIGSLMFWGVLFTTIYGIVFQYWTTQAELSKIIGLLIIIFTFLLFNCCIFIASKICARASTIEKINKLSNSARIFIVIILLMALTIYILCNKLIIFIFM